MSLTNKYTTVEHETHDVKGEKDKRKCCFLTAILTIPVHMLFLYRVFKMMAKAKQICIKVSN